MTFFKGKLSLLLNDDNSIYRLLLAVLLVAGTGLYFLCANNTFDPFWLRLAGSGLCLITVGASFLPNLRWYHFFKYLTGFYFLAINNYLLIAENGFANIYIFNAAVVFAIVCLFCRFPWEFVLISAVNMLAVVVAYFSTANKNLPLLTFSILQAFFIATAYIIFLVKEIFRQRFKRAVQNIMLLNRTLTINDEHLRQSRKQMDGVINAIDDIIFVLDPDRNCIDVWFNESRQRHFNPKIFINKPLTDVIGIEKARPFTAALDYVCEHKTHTDIEFPSVFGTPAWFMARFTPTFDPSGSIERIIIAVADITKQKKNSLALQENELQLIEAQKIARIGSWWHDTVTGENYWSDVLLSIMEIASFPESISKFDYYLNLIHPDDREKVLVYFSSIRSSSETTLEHRLNTPNGNLKYVKIIRGNISETGRITGIIQDVTDSKIAERIIKKSQMELMEAQRIAKIGNWRWDAGTNALSWSEEIYNIYEIDSESRQQFSIVKLMLKHVHQDDKEILHHFLKSSGMGLFNSYEFRILTLNGNLKYISIIIGSVMHRDDQSIKRVIGTLQDVTERKKAEIDQITTKSKYQTVFENVRLAAITLDQYGNITFCNKYLADLLGYEQNEILQLNLMEHLVPEEIRETLYGWVTDNNIPASVNNPLLCRNGEQRIISWQNIVSYDEYGRIKEITGIGEDITERQKTTRALITAKEQAEKSSQSKSEFLSIMSHEIRTPMNAVIGTTNLLLSEDPRPEQLEYLNTLKFSGENLLSIINDILDYNKIEAGKLELNHLPFNIHTLLSQLRQSFYAKAAEKNLSIESVADEAIPENLIGDQLRLGQILNNLLSNAVKFTSKGTIILKTELVTRQSSRVGLKFIVSDTGIGIAPQNQSKIFEPFIQETQFIQNEYGGTGLGLAITKRLIEMHGGEIAVESTPGVGTSFYFTVDFDVQLTVEKATVVPLTVASAPRSLTGMRVLLVDDNKMNLMIASKFLKKWDAEIDEACDGLIAVNMAAVKEYDLIIMDLQMPVMDGLEATLIIKKTQPLLPVIALTADAMTETYTKALEAGMDDYLTKPFVPDVLFEKVYRYYKPLAIGIAAS